MNDSLRRVAFRAMWRRLCHRVVAGVLEADPRLVRRPPWWRGGYLGHDLLQANQPDSVDNTGQCGELVLVFVASVRGDRGPEPAALSGKGAGIYFQLLQGGDLLLWLVRLSQPLLHHHACPCAGGGLHGLLLGRLVRGRETAERGEGHLTLVPGRGGHRLEQVSATRQCCAFSNRAMKVNPL